jgi:hypothetical protein
MRRHRKCQPHIHAGAIPVDSFTPAHLTFQAACGSLIRKFSQSAPPSELPCGSLPRRIPAPRFPSGFPGRLGAPACRYTARNQRTRQFHRTSAQFGLLSSRFAKPFGPACGTLSRCRPPARFGLPHPQNRAVKKNVLICASPPALHPLGQPPVALPTGFPALRFPPWPVKCEAYFTGPRQLRMKPRADLEQRSNPPVDSLTPVRLTLRAAFSSLPRSFPSCLGHLDRPRRLSRHPRKNLQQSALPGAIAPDNPHNLAGLDIERHIAQGPKFRASRGVGGRESRGEGGRRRILRFIFFETGEECLHLVAHRLRTNAPKLVALGDITNGNNGFRHLTDRFEFNHGFHGLTRIEEPQQGLRLASQSGVGFSNPFTSELARDFENPAPLSLRERPRCSTLAHRNLNFI